jgi:hypothetical protein
VSAPLILKHDEQTTNSPGLEQLILGELAINSVTGKIFTRIRPPGAPTDGTGDVVFEFVGQPICFTKMPIITFDPIDRFCCSGDLLKVKVSDLIANQEYRFELEDLSANNVTTTINDPVYTPYSSTLPNGNTINYKEAIVPITVAINGNKPWTIFKFKVLGKNNDLNAELTSKTITISCEN